MEAWFAEVNRTINWLLGFPSGSSETFAVWFVSLTSLLLVMRIATSMYGMRDVAWLPLILSLLIGIYALVGVCAVVNLYLLRLIKDPTWRHILTFGFPVGGYLLFAVPAQAELMKSNFLKSFLAFTTSALVTLIAINAVNIGFSSIQVGGNKSDTIRNRATNFQNLLNE